MANAAAYIPPGEMLRFGCHLLLRLAIATIAGVVIMKLGQAVADWTAVEAQIFGKWAVGIIFFGSLYLKRIPWPETKFKGLDKTPLADPSFSASE